MSVFDFIASVLLLEHPPTLSDEQAAERRLFALKVQQVSGPVAAKGVEDTAAYRYVALLSLNEVGGDLQQFGRSVAAFHRANIRRLERWPLEMTTTSTHDTKRGEDARARISVLSDIPGDWRNAAATWMRLNKPHHTLVNDEPAPDRNDEYHFYQALLAVWPPETADAPVPAGAPGVLVERVHAYMIKAIREAKVHTSWVNPNAPYETAVGRFVERTLRGTGAARFLPAFVPFARRVARLGAINALAQLVLKVASPGIPDLYQGTELWDLTLVDPDNRQPVDYAARTSALDELEPWLARAGTSASGPDDELARAAGALVDAWPDGRVKLFLTALGLRLRRMKPELFLHGTYAPLDVEGWRADHVVAFAREQASELLVAVVPRLGGALGGDFSKWPTESATWGDTRLRLRQGWNGHVFRHLITGELVTPVRTTTDDWIAAAQIFDRFPVALLWTERTGAS